MSNITLKQLEAFVEVSKQGSFRLASTTLNTTQPNISTRISTLESLLGHRLMERDAGSVRLTPIGEELLQKAQQVLVSLDNLLVTSRNNSLFDGVLRLGVTETIAHSWLGEFLTRFNDRFPKVTVDLTVDLSSSLSQALHAGALDLAFQSGPFDEQVALSSDLGEVRLCWVASPSLVVPARKLHKNELASFIILSHSKNTLPYKQLASHMADHNSQLRLVPSTSLAACLQMTLQGIGIACLPMAIVKEALAHGALKRLSYDWQPDALKFEARCADPNARHFIRTALELSETIAKEDAA